MRNTIFLALTFLTITSCKKEDNVNNGAYYNEITFKISDTIFYENKKQSFGIFTIDAQGLALEKIQFETELENWDQDIQQYIKSIELTKTSPGNKVSLIDSTYNGGSCTHKWTLINQEHLIDPMDTYQIFITTQNSFISNYSATAYAGFYIRNLFNDIEIIHGAAISGYPQKIYFQK